MPFAVQTLVIFYNKNLLDRAGIQQPPRTWDQFIAALKTLKDDGIMLLANGGKEGWTLEVAFGVLGPTFFGGATFYDAVTHGQTTFRNPAFTGALGKFADIRPYMPQGYMGVAYTDMQCSSLNEQAAMYVGGIFELGYSRAKTSPSRWASCPARSRAPAIRRGSAVTTTATTA